MRRLAAIMVTDVAGYSRRMGRDEAATLAALRTLRVEVLEPTVARHAGRLVKLMGDGALVEFASAVAAVECAVAIQQAMRARRGAGAADDPLELRIGIDIGDIVIEPDAHGGEDIYGDGVNVAARLQTIADPDGIVVSGAVVDQVRDKTRAVFEPLGTPDLKNIERAVAAFAVHEEGASRAGAMPRVLERPAVAILPFLNLSGDPGQEYFADGITEELITALSAWRSFPVIARNSTFAFRGRSEDVTRIGKALGARYVVEGRVQRAGERVRIGAQLVDASTGLHLWAQSYDRQLGDVFDLQDEITRSIVCAIEPQLTRAEQQRAARKRPENLDGWDLTLQALAQIRKGNPTALKRADELLGRALDMDPASSYAQSLRALTCWLGALAGWTEDPARSLSSTYDAAKAAVALDDCDWLAHALLGIATLWKHRDYDAARAEMEMALELNPSAAIAYHFHGCVLTFDSHPAEAITQLRAVLQLDPRFQFLSGTLADIGLAHLLLGEHVDAIRLCERALTEKDDNVRAWQRLAAALAHVGRLAEARDALARAAKLLPGFDRHYVETTYPFRDPAHTTVLCDGLHKAGWNG